MFAVLFVVFASALAVKAASRTSPPSGAIVVQAGTKYTTVSEAVAALPDNSSDQVIFIYPGTYNEQVYIDVSDSVTVYGYTSNTDTYADNEVNIVYSISLEQAGSDDLTGTLRVHSNNVKLYNINVYNNYGEAATNGQALALSAYGSNFGAYACGFYSYQDTVLAEEGNQVYLGNYIEGAVDFIFGQHAVAWFQGNTIAVKGPGAVTAAGPSSSTDGQLYVFQSNTIEAASGYTSTRDNYLGRPWSEYAHVVFLDTTISTVINTALWEEWSSSTPNTADVLFADYGTTGSGASGISRPSYATLLSSSQAADYTISTVLGSSYTSWVDTSYL